MNDDTLKKLEVEREEKLRALKSKIDTREEHYNARPDALKNSFEGLRFKKANLKLIREYSKRMEVHLSLKSALIETKNELPETVNPMKHPIAKFLIYADDEIPIIIQSVIDFVKTNQNSLSVVQAFQIGVCAVEFQYNIRTLKARIHKLSPVSAFDVRTNNKFIRIMENFPDWLDDLIEKYEKYCQDNEECTFFQKYGKGKQRSSLTMSNHEKQEIYESIEILDLAQYLND